MIGFINEGARQTRFVEALSLGNFFFTTRLTDTLVMSTAISAGDMGENIWKLVCRTLYLLSSFLNRSAVGSTNVCYAQPVRITPKNCCMQPSAQVLCCEPIPGLCLWDHQFE